MFLYNHEDIFRKYYNKSDIDIRIVWTLTDNIEIVKNKKDEKGFKKIISLLKKYDKGKEWDWKDKKGGIVAWIPFTHLVAWETLLFYESYGNRGKFDSAFSNYIKYIWNVSDDLNDLAWTYYQNIDDNYKLQLAIKCVKRSIEIRTNANNFDTYAMLLYKTGSYKEALSQEELALDDAKKSKKDIKPFSDKIQLIKKSLK
jgi:tetratricopeptide (TPR) repeat protein